VPVVAGDELHKILVNFLSFRPHFEAAGIWGIIALAVTHISA
jgi:hypothetical protein